MPRWSAVMFAMSCVILLFETGNASAEGNQLLDPD
jgi:hypothetical protein